LLRQTLQVRVTSDTQKIQSSDWPKWRCTLWRSVNYRVFVGHQTSFQQVCRYVNSTAVPLQEEKTSSTNLHKGTIIPFFEQLKSFSYNWGPYPANIFWQYDMMCLESVELICVHLSTLCSYQCTRSRTYGIRTQTLSVPVSGPQCKTLV